MKNLKILLAIPSMLSIVSCEPNFKSVDDPYVESVNSTAIDIRKVEISDTATSLYVDLYHRPVNFVPFNSSQHLEVDGKSFALKSIEGAEIDKEFKMPKSGEASFRLHFEPIPIHTASFNYLGENAESKFNVYGVDLTQKKTYEKPEGLPENLLSDTSNFTTSLPHPDFVVKETKVNFHLLNDMKQSSSSLLKLGISDVFGIYDEYEIKDFRQNKVVEKEFWLCGPSLMKIMLDFRLVGSVWLKPGDTVDLYIDGKKMVYDILNQRSQKKHVKSPQMKSLYASGAYGCFAQGSDMLSNGPMLSFLLNQSIISNDLTADQFTDNFVSRYHSFVDSVNQTYKNSSYREFSLKNVKQGALLALICMDENKVRIGGNTVLKPKHYEKISKLFDVTDPKILYGNDFGSFIKKLSACNTKATPCLKYLGLDNTLYRKIGENRKYLKKIDSNANLTEQDLQSIHQIDNTFIRESILKKYEVAKQRLNNLEGKVEFEKTPNVADDKLFETIIAPYKGKVVLVDFWNTWCGPCQHAIKTNEVLKKSKLKDLDIVWIYIANETSPIVKYKQTILDINGKHYRLNRNQWNVILKHFGITGIPSYVLVDKAGNPVLRNDFRDHDVLCKTLKEMAK